MNDPRIRQWGLRLAVGFLLAGLAISIFNHPELIFNLRLGPVLILLIVTVPMTLILNAVEFSVSGRLVHAKLDPLRCLEVIILGSAANMLPLPGSTLVRIAGLKTAGAGYTDSTAVTLLIGATWVGVAFACAGIGVLVLQSYLLAGAFLAIGAIALTASLIFFWRLSQNLRLIAYLLATKFALVLIDIGRIFLCFGALGVSTTAWQAAVFSISGVLGSAASIVPAGLGIREGVSAAIAPLVGLSASTAFLAAALNRLAGLAVVVPVALTLTRFSKRQLPT